MDIIYIPIEDAAELTGYSIKYLRKLSRTNQIRIRSNNAKVMVAWNDVKRLATNYKPFWVTLPDSAVNTEIPDPKLLLYTGEQEKFYDSDSSNFLNQIEVGNCIDWMKKMPGGIVQSVVTSPPYWGVRKYPGDLAIEWSDGKMMSFGEEATVEEYVAHTLEILRHLKRVLKQDGTIWWNIGDTYQTRAYLRESSTERLHAIEGKNFDVWSKYPNKRYSSGHPYLKDKDLTLVPFLVAIGAERIGFYVRSIIIWHKDNSGIESAKDRPVNVCEYILLLAKSRFYKYHLEREQEDAASNGVIKRINGKSKYKLISKRNSRNVWQFPPSNSHGEHTAAFPMELPMRCLRLSTEPGDLVFDPFTGSGTTLAAANLLGCHYFGCDIIKEYVADAKRRLKAPDKALMKNKKGVTQLNSLKLPFNEG